jgi:hypothetical protein
MRVRSLLLLWIVIVVPLLPAKTLNQLLLEEQIPSDYFSAEELAQTVGGTIFLGGPDELELAYDVLAGESAYVSSHVVKYDKKRGVLLKSKLQTDKTEVCFGPFTGMLHVGEFTLVSTHISPSAGCLLVLDDQMAQKATLYGFSPRPVAPNRVVLIEDMIHFSPVHPERLQLADLKLGTTFELYPSKGDAMRARLASENATHMPTRAICMKMNDPCDPHLFDEEILAIATGPEDRFALIVKQSASHVTVPEESPVTVASQSVLYIYAPSDYGWIYCQAEVSNQEATMRTQASRLRSWQFNDTAGRCTPNLPVLPDMSTSVVNPFSKKAN